MATDVTAVDFIPVDNAGDTMTGPLILSADPLVALGAATKQYADLTGAGFFILAPCVASSTADLGATYNNLGGVGDTLTNNGVQVVFSVDGQSPIVGERVLVPFQTATEENGIYEVTDVGSVATDWILTRTTDFDTAVEMLPGTFITVTAGTLYAQSSWIETATIVTPGTDPVIWAQFTSSPNTFAKKELDNLSGVAVNTPLLSTLDSSIDFGSATNRWDNTYTLTLRTGEGAGHEVKLQAYDVDGLTYVTFGTLTANNTPTFELASDVIATTQAASDNTTKLATTAYVDAQVANDAATKALDNLAAVAINTSLVSDTDITDDLGTDAIRWKDGYIENLKAGKTATDTLTLQAYDTDLVGYVTFATLTSDTTPTMSLSGSVTGVTQAPANNSTKLATTAYADAAAAGAGATKALDNLAAVAINTTLVSDTDVTDNLGTQAIRWNNIYAANLQTGDTAADTLKIGAWDVDGAVISDFITLTANNTPTCVLASGVTATTQAPADNSTKIATTAYADAIGSAGANTALSNLAAVAINTSLVSDTDVTDSLGTQAVRWNNIYAANLQTGDTAADTLKIGAWDVDGAVIADFITLTANNTPTCVLASGVTGTTQAPADNSTKLATTAYVDSASGANTALSNLAAVAINTSLVSDTDNTDSLGTGAIRWKDIYSATLKTGTTAANTLVISARDVDGAVDTPFITLTADNTPTCVIASAVTGTTQAVSDNSTKLATTAYADAQVGAIAANKALSNLAGVAINTTLVSDTDVTDDLGTLAIRWNNIYAAKLSSGDTAADVLTLSAYDVDGAVTTNFITLTSNNTPTCVIASGVTGTTQAASNNSTKLATTAYVDTQVLTTGASKALDNLASVAINTSLVSDTDVTDDLGTAAKRWSSGYISAIKTGTTAAQTTVISARDVDGAVDTAFITLTANNTPTCVLSGDVTGTTQAAANNSTKLATTAYADAVGVSAGSLVYIATGTAAASATVDFSNNLSATYNNYLIVFENVLFATDAVSAYMRFGTGAGPTYQATNYQSGCLSVVGAIAFAGPTTAIGINSTARIENTSPKSGGGSLKINSVNAAVDKIATGTSAWVDSTAAGENSGCFGGRWKDTTVITSVRFLASAGNTTTGVYRLYGIKNS